MTFYPDTITAQAIMEVIGKAGFESSRVETAEATPTVPAEPWKAPLPESAPEYFKQAFARARESGRPIVLDFSATWCVPCVRLRKETLEAPAVKAVLTGVELIYIDVDVHPSLAQAYGVKAVPDVFFVNRQGRVIDRLRNFETADLFLRRVEKLVKAVDTPGVD